MTAAGGVTMRQLAGPDELRACVELQRITWGLDFEGLVPASVLKIVPRTGGVVAGAFDVEGALLGFVLGWTGVRSPGSRRAHPGALPGTAGLAAAGGRTGSRTDPAPPLGAPDPPAGRSPLAGALGGPPDVFHWSHMLAVAPAARDLGVGRKLKLYQRELLVPLGVETMEWTYDPLEARNAHLNLNVLGAEVVEYVEDMYKGEAGSDLAKGLGTDRFIVSWRVAPPVPTAGDRMAAAAATARFTTAPRVDPAPPDGAEVSLPEAPRVLVEVPARIQEFKEDEAERALAYRLGTRRAFESYLARGYRVTAFLRSPDGRCHYGVERGGS